LAWGMTGHRVVGEIADKYLSSKARKEIRKILGNESIAMSSNWADFIKSDTNFRYLNPWHYVNFDSGITYTQMVAFLDKDTAVDAYTKIVFLTKELKAKSLSLETKQFYLRLLIHLVGDIHQPLHATKKGISGGNDIRVSWFSENSNLHRVWDSDLIDHQQLSYTEYVKAINYVTPAEKATWQRQPLTEWLFESYQISLKLTDEIKTPNPRLGYEYNFKHLETMNKQLLKGGVHLATLLNQIYG
ncbi:MAG TPA: S1/P1 nuclease, partial [Segetibacter sp.]